MKSEFRVFISSVFTGMEKERDALQNIVFPKVERYCAEHGITFLPIELRWGVNDDDVSSGDFIKKCLSEIDKCRPFFIGILGDEYGTIIKGINQTTLKEFPMISDRYVGISVAELEMRYAFLDSPSQNKHTTFFYIRKPYSASHRPENNLDALKNDIINSGCPVHNGYNNIEQFQEFVYSDLIDCIKNHIIADKKRSRQDWFIDKLS